MAPANAATLRKLRADRPDNKALAKYARLGHLFSGKNGSDEYLQDCFIAYLSTLLHELGQEKVDFTAQPWLNVEKVVAESGVKNNPVELDAEELTAILTRN